MNVPGLMNFVLFKVDNRLEDIKLYGGSKAKYRIIKLLFDYLTDMQDIITEAIQTQPQFEVPGDYEHIKKLVKGVIGYGNKMGEGWLITAEMGCLAKTGTLNIVCTQPFGCLPNHIVAKGMSRRVKDEYPDANIVAIDYDPSATSVNQENRLKLMLANIREKPRT